MNINILRLIAIYQRKRKLKLKATINNSDTGKYNMQLLSILLYQPTEPIISIFRAGLIGGYQLDKHPMQIEHYKLSCPQLYSLPQLDEKHPKRDTHSCLGMEFDEVDM